MPQFPICKQGDDGTYIMKRVPSADNSSWHEGGTRLVLHQRPTQQALRRPPRGGETRICSAPGVSALALTSCPRCFANQPVEVTKASTTALLPPCRKRSPRRSHSPQPPGGTQSRNYINAQMAGRVHPCPVPYSLGIPVGPFALSCIPALPGHGKGTVGSTANTLGSVVQVMYREAGECSMGGVGRPPRTTRAARWWGKPTQTSTKP
jgi:hypothetical protein